MSKVKNTKEVKKKGDVKYLRKFSKIPVFTTKKKYFAVFLVKEEGTYNVLKIIPFKPENPAIRYAVGNSHIINIEKPTYLKGLKVFYFIDIKHGQMFFDGATNSGQNPALVDGVMKQEIIKQINEGIFQGKGKITYMTLILAFGLGIALGFIIKMFI